jgi:nitrogen regulatory protein PII
MKEISIYIPTHDLEQVSEILRKHNVGGISFYEINGAGRTQRKIRNSSKYILNNWPFNKGGIIHPLHQCIPSADVFLIQ